jgi:hypothetical protein
MNLDKIIEEIYDSGGGNYPAYSEPPRKDFAPMSNRSGYENPYQRGGASEQPREQGPEGAPSMPWPLQTLNDDISDSFVFLTAGMTKMIQTVKLNPALDKEAKDELLDLYKKSKVALNLLKEIGLSVGKLNMAKPQPIMNPVPINPDQAIDPRSLPNPNPTIAIKLP